MTYYQGGKRILGPRIAEIMKEHSGDRKHYVELFCGMCGVAKHFWKEDYSLDLSDSNPNIFLFWEGLKKKTWQPKPMTKEEWLIQKTALPSADRCFAAYGLSFSGYEFSKYSDRATTQQIKSILKDQIAIQNARVNFYCADYRERLDIKDSIIYLDPPYANHTLRSKFFYKFDHDEFWNLATELGKRNNVVFVSERVVPEAYRDRWELVFEKNLGKACLGGRVSNVDQMDRLFKLV